MQFFPPIALLAGIDDWLQFLVPAVFVAIWLISQIMGAGRNKPAPPRRRQPRPDQGQGGLAGQIERFLKEVQQEWADQQRPAQPGRRRQPGPGRPPRAPQGAAPPVQPQVVEAEVVEAEVVEPWGGRAPRRRPLGRLEADSGQTAAGPRPPAARPTPPAAGPAVDRVDLADEKMAEHMQEVFEHEVGALADTSDAIHEKGPAGEPAVSAAVPTTSQAVRDMLAQPDSVRKAVVLSEILRPPQQRWQ